MGVRHARCRSRACSSTPSRSCPSTAPRADRELPGAIDDGPRRTSSGPSQPRTARCFWLDGGGAREWSGRRSLDRLARRRRRVADLRRRAPRGHPARRRRVVGRGRRHLRRARGRRWCPASSGSATSATPAAPTCPPARTRPCPTPCGCGRGTCGRSSTRGARRRSPRICGDDVPALQRSRRRRKPREVGQPRGSEAYAEAFARVQEQLRAGNSYEVNLTYRLARAATDPTRPRPTSGSATSTPRRTPGSSSTTSRTHRAWLLSSSPERYALITPDRTLADQADQGHHAPRRDAERGRGAAGSGSPPTRRPAPRT